MAERYEYNFGTYDPQISPNIEFLNFITNGGWRIVHMVLLPNGLIFMAYERQAPSG